MAEEAADYTALVEAGAAPCGHQLTAAGAFVGKEGGAK